MILCVCALLFLPVATEGKTYTLEECIDIAVSNNHEILSARNAVKSNEAGVLSAWSNFLPRLDAYASYNRAYAGSTQTVDSEGRPYGFPGYYYSRYSSSVSMSYDLFRGGRSFAYMSKTRADLDAGKLSLAETIDSVELETSEMYFQLLKAITLVEVQREALNLSEEQLNRAESLFELGAASMSDVLKARVQVGEQRLQLLELENNVEKSRAQLASIMGMDVGTPIEPVDVVEATLDVPPDVDFGLAVEKRPKVRAYKSYVRGAAKNLDVARGARYPTLTATGGYSWSSSEAPEEFDDFSRNYSWNLYLSLSVPLFDGFSTKASINSARAELSSAEDALKEARREAILDAQTSLLDLEKARQQVELAMETVRQAEEDYSISEERYRLGAGSMLELIDSQVALATAKSSLVEARYDYEIAKAYVVRSLAMNY
jgi:TolC family type I secretion outer membrane protein